MEVLEVTWAVFNKRRDDKVRNVIFRKEAGEEWANGLKCLKEAEALEDETVKKGRKEEAVEHLGRMLRCLGCSMNCDISLLLGKDVRDLTSGDWIKIGKRWELEQVWDKSGDIDVTKWLNYLISAEGLEQTECLLFLLPECQKIEKEKMSWIIMLIEAKFGPFICANE
jgi:hypothetical protein